QAEGLVLEGDAAALRVVEARDALLQRRVVKHVVVKRVGAAEPVVSRMRSRGRVEVRVGVVEARKLLDERALAPRDARLQPAGPRVAAAERNRAERMISAVEFGAH